MKETAHIAQHAKTPTLVHRMKPHKGQTVYEYNPKENTIKVVESETAPANYAAYTKRISKVDGSVVSSKSLEPVRKRVIVDPDCFYIAALNTKNAIKKIRRISVRGFLLFPNANPQIK